MEPNIFECSDHKEFLSDVLEKKGKTGGLRSLAKSAGFKSPGQLSMLIHGKRRLTRRSAEMLAQALRLKGKRKAIFFAFSRLDSSKSESERLSAREELIRLKSFQPEHRINAKQFSFLSTWYYPVIYTLIEFLPQENGKQWLAERLGEEVSVEEVSRALADLEELGFTQKLSGGGWKQIKKAISTPEDVRNVAVAKYHKNSLRLAGEALELPLEQREFNGLTTVVPARLLPAVKERVRRFRSDLNEFLSAQNELGDVYQINLHVFPITKNIEGKSL